MRDGKKRMRHTLLGLHSSLSCPHGPLAILEQWCNDTKIDVIVACTAYRDIESQSMKTKKLNCGCVMTPTSLELMENEEHRTRLKVLSEKFMVNMLKSVERGRSSLHKCFNKTNIRDEEHLVDFCSDCLMFNPASCGNGHKGHQVHRGLRLSQIGMEASKTLTALSANRAEAQYHFDVRTIEVLVNIIESNDIKFVVCLGMPSIHEYILRHKSFKMTSVLLDLDHRQALFQASDKYCCYNMFNHHFIFNQECYSNFVDLTTGNRVIIVVDPPFSGKCELLAGSLHKMRQDFDQAELMWIAPYFMEKNIVVGNKNCLDTGKSREKAKKHNQEELKMTDFTPMYTNHPRLTTTRLYTTLTHVPLPTNEYSYCDLCSRFVAKWNRHCFQCNECTSKNGTTYVHCQQCCKCVKRSFRHCKQCNKCALPDHPCNNVDNVKGNKKANNPERTNRGIGRKRNKEKQLVKNPKRKKL